MNILYLVHDVYDAAVLRRARMLRHAGAKITIAGFRRNPDPMNTVDDFPVIDFGQTFNADLRQRIVQVVKTLYHTNRHKILFKNADAIVARNLEMLSIAAWGRKFFNTDAHLIYEVLDIHRVLLADTLKGKMFRLLEGWLSHSACRLWTSSPAFIREYFDKISEIDLPVTLVENKVFDPQKLLNTPPVHVLQPGPPWVIGWFGMIRCRKSIEILRDLVLRENGRIQVIIRGQPIYDQISDFDDIVAQTDGLHFMGPYKNPDDLANIYNEVHFCWAIDLYEEGLNSSWLLPNRIYEGGVFSAIPITLRHVETGAHVRALGTGIWLENMTISALQGFFNTLNPQIYEELKHAAHAVSKEKWIAGDEDCRALLESITKS